MQPVDNSHFTEEQRAEAYRSESMRELIKQTKALESIRGILIGFTVLFVLGVIMWIALVVVAGRP